MGLSSRRQLVLLLRGARIESGLSQKSVGEELGYKGSQFISNIERGLCLPPLNVLKKMVKIYEIDPASIYSILLRMRDLELRVALGMSHK